MLAEDVGDKKGTYRFETPKYREVICLGTYNRFQVVNLYMVSGLRSSSERITHFMSLNNNIL